MIDFNAIDRLVTGTLFHQEHQAQNKTDSSGSWAFSEPPNASHFTGKLTKIHGQHNLQTAVCCLAQQWFKKLQI